MADFKFTLHSPEDIQQWKDPEWLIKNVLPLNSFAEIIGKWESGKTFVALDWGLSVAAGIPWGDKHPVKQGGVLYVFGEGKPGVKQRINAWFDHYEIDPNKVPFRAVDLPLQLYHMDDVNKFTQDVDAQFGDEDINLIIFDTLARSIVGVDEDSAEGMGVVVSSLEYLRRGYESTVLTVHHTGHNNPKRGRGSSVFPAAIDTSILCVKKTDSRVIKVTCEKIKDGERFEPMAVTLMDSKAKSEDGKPMTLVSELGGRVPAEDPLDILSRSPNQQKLLNFMVKERSTGATYKDLKEELVIKEGSFHPALTSLTQLGFVEKIGPLYYPSSDGTEVFERPEFN